MKKTIKKVLAKSPLKKVKAAVKPKAAKAKTAKSKASSKKDQQVAEVAYQIFERRGYVDGFEAFDWYLAQQLVDAQSAYKPNRRKRVTDAINQEIEKKAYEFAEQRGFNHGSQDLDWYLARELVYFTNNLPLD